MTAVVCSSARVSEFVGDHRLNLEQVFVYIMYIIVHTGRPPPTQCPLCVFLYIHLKYTRVCTIWYCFTFQKSQSFIICCVNSACRLSGPRRSFTEFMDEMIHLLQLVKPKRRSADGAPCRAFSLTFTL